MKLETGRILKQKEICGYKIIVYNLYTTLVQLYVFDKEDKLLKIKSYDIGEQTSTKKLVMKNINHHINLIKEVILNKLPITEDDYDILTIDKKNNK